MPAGFNKGQIEYIKTIANVNGHKSYKTISTGTTNHTVTDGRAADCDSKLKYAIWCLGTAPITYPPGAVDENTNMVQDAHTTSIVDASGAGVYTVPINTNVTTANAEQRVTPECFLESVSMKMRHITDLDNAIDAQSHKEFRLVVFRHREKQHASAQLSENRSNPLYDMFHGALNYKYGPKGYRAKMDDQGTINYTNWSSYEPAFDRDAMVTDAINSEDYIVMKDCRYYLGREYGGKHIYEDRFFWDHEDPIATDHHDISFNDSNKNYCWYIMLMGINNSTATAIDNLGYVRFSSNTYVTSG